MLPGYFSEFAHAQYAAPFGVVTLVCIAILFFIFQYMRSSYRIERALRLTLSHFKEAAALSDHEKRRRLGDIFDTTPFAHSWQEYSETLHDQFDQGTLVRSRATTSAAHFFSAQSIVETPMRTEFYKHLPGVLTGIGIVGTFAGLMLGLSHFDPSDTSHIQKSVKGLLDEVRFAFVGSSIAIAISILVTLVEKHRLRVCYDYLEKLIEEIDKLFLGGVAEEYLADLVASSRESSIQTRLLKDSLVTDLREMLKNLVDTQIQENLKLSQALTTSYRESGKQLADQVSGAIEGSLKAPLEALAGAVQTATGDRSNQVQNLLQDVLVAFMSKLESSFGQQFSGLSEMMGQSVNSMQAMQSNFASLIQEMRSAAESSNQASATAVNQLIADMQAGQTQMHNAMLSMLDKLQSAVANMGGHAEDAGVRMAAQLEKLFAESESRQRLMAESLQQFVESIKESVGQGQQETMQKVSASVEVLGHQLTNLFKQFAQNRQQLEQSSLAAQENLHHGTRDLLAGLDEQVKTLLGAVNQQQQATEKTLSLLNEQTQNHLSGMQQGADKMRLAAERFETAGAAVSQATESNTALFGKVNTATADLTGAMRDLGVVVNEYRANRDAAVKTLAAIESIVATNQNEAQTRSQFIADMRQQSEQLRLLNKEANEYVGKVNEVLSNSFAEFGDGMDRSLRKTLGSLDIELDKAIKHLGGAVSELSEHIEELGETVEKAVRLQ